MSFSSCLVGLPKINWGAVNRENQHYQNTSYWCVTHMETHRVWRGRSCWDSTDRWDKTHPIQGFDRAETRLKCIWEGDKGLWKLREVTPYELEHSCIKGEDGKYRFKELKFPHKYCDPK